MTNWRKVPNEVGDWIKIEVWDCGCVEHAEAIEIDKAELRWYAFDYRVRDDVFFLKVDLPRKISASAPCREWRDA